MAGPLAAPGPPAAPAAAPPHAYATLGEIRQAMVKVYGEYREPAVF